MLFCDPDEVDRTWEVVAKATANNKLGIAAKVAPTPVKGLGDPHKERVICIYSANFADRADVERILRRLEELKLVKKFQHIYYKPGKSTDYILTKTKNAGDSGVNQRL